jgi:hypothetical protein
VIEGEGLGGFARRVTVNDSAEELDRPLLSAALRRLMLYRFKLMANASIKRPNQGTRCSVLRRSVKQRQFCRVSYETTNGDVKWTDATRNSWTSKCEDLRRHEMKA